MHGFTNRHNLFTLLFINFYDPAKCVEKLNVSPNVTKKCNTLFLVAACLFKFYNLKINNNV
jgi:hypothetical protein